MTLKNQQCCHWNIKKVRHKLQPNFPNIKVVEFLQYGVHKKEKDENYEENYFTKLVQCIKIESSTLGKDVEYYDSKFHF